MSEFPQEDFPEKVPRNTAAKFIAAGVCLAFSVLLFILVWCAHASVLMAFSAMFLCAAAALALYGLGDVLNSRTPPRSAMPLAALALDLACLPCLLISFVLLLSGDLWQWLALIFLIGVVACPVGGMALAVVCLTRGAGRIGRWGVGVSVAALALPVAAVAVIIPLYSAGVFVIALM